MTPLEQKLIAAGFVPNEFLLQNNGCLEDPAPRYPRSRMFKFPVALERGHDRLTVAHTLMTFEPFVQRVMITLGQPVDVEPEPRSGCGIWHHAGDLANDTCFRDLLKTAVYVTPRAIMRGVSMGVMGNCLSTTNARVIMATIEEAHETNDRSAFNLSNKGGILHPSFIDDGATSGKGKWAVNLHSRRDPVGEVWAAIHGVEDGWFTKTKYGYHNMTIAGLIRFMGGPPAP